MSHPRTFTSLMTKALKDGGTFVFVDAKGDPDMAKEVMAIAHPPVRSEVDADSEESAASSTPSRKGLILGAALVALHGLQQESLLEARHWRYENWDDHKTYAECKRLYAALRAGQSASTSFERIVDLMAHTRQTLHVSIEEWEDAVPLTLIDNNLRA